MLWGVSRVPASMAYKSVAVAKWAHDGSLEQAFIASVAYLAKEKHLDLRALHGDGTNTVAQKGATALATRATNTKKGRRSLRSRTTMALSYSPPPGCTCE